MKILRRLRLPLDPRVGWIVLAGQLMLPSALADAQVAGTVDPKGTAAGTIVYTPREPADSNERMSSLLSVRLSELRPRRKKVVLPRNRLRIQARKLSQQQRMVAEAQCRAVSPRHRAGRRTRTPRSRR